MKNLFLMMLSVLTINLVASNLVRADDSIPLCSDKNDPDCISDDELAANSEDGNSEDSPKGYRVIFEKVMSESSCEQTILALASQYGLGVDGKQLIEEDDQVGEAYYSQGSCHFYIW